MDSRYIVDKSYKLHFQLVTFLFPIITSYANWKKSKRNYILVNYERSIDTVATSLFHFRPLVQAEHYTRSIVFEIARLQYTTIPKNQPSTDDHMITPAMMNPRSA